MTQKKPDYYYEQSAVIPYRWRDDQLEILMITSRKRKRWLIPKGIIEPHLTAAASATHEALEEAGIEGKVSARPIGTYQYDKWGGTCTVTVFVMAVTQQHETWLEDFRDREWVSLATAVKRTREEKLKQLLQSLPEFLEVEEL